MSLVGADSAAQLAALSQGGIVVDKQFALDDGDAAGEQVVVARDAIGALAFLDESKFHGGIVVIRSKLSSEKCIAVVSSYHIV